MRPTTSLTGRRSRRRARLAAAAAALAALALAPPPAASAQGPPAVRSANVSWVANLPERGPISLAVHGSTMFVSTLRGLATYDVSRPEAPVRLGFMPLPAWQNEDVATNGQILLISRDAGLGLARLHVVDVRDPARPALLSTLDTTDSRLRGQGESIGHTATCVDGCRFAYLAGAGRIDVVDLRDPANPRFASPRRLPVREAACARPGVRRTCAGTHDVQVDDRGVAWITGVGGTAGYDVSDPLAPRLVASTGRLARSTAFSGQPRRRGRDTLNDLIHHNALRLSEDVVAVTEEAFGDPGCARAGRFQTWRIGPGGMRPLDTWGVERDPQRRVCSAHYFDHRDGIVAQGFYEGGTRFLDVRDPRRIRQVGWYIPRRGESFAAYFAPTDPTGQLVYVADSQRGVDVLRLDRASGPGARRPARQRRGSAVPSQPNVAVGVSNGRDGVARGQTLRTSAVVVNTGRRALTGVDVVVELSAGLELVRGGAPDADGRRTRFHVGRLPAAGRRSGGVRRLPLVVRVRRDPGLRLVEVAAVATIRRDVYAPDDFAVDRDRVGRSRRAQASGAPALVCRPPRAMTFASPVRLR